MKNQRRSTRKNRKASRKNRKQRYTRKQSGGDCGCMKGILTGGGDPCPKGGDHTWVRINPKNMAGWCKCSKCGAKEAGKC